MSRAMARTRRHKRKTARQKIDQGLTTERLRAFLLNRLMNRDPRSHAEFLHDMRAKEAAGRLVNPATAALLDRLERAI